MLMESEKEFKMIGGSYYPVTVDDQPEQLVVGMLNRTVANKVSCKATVGLAESGKCHR